MTLRLLSYNIRYGGEGREAALLTCHPRHASRTRGHLPGGDPARGDRAAGAGRVAWPQWASLRRQSLGFMSRRPVAHYAWHRPRLSRHAFPRDRPRGCRGHGRRRSPERGPCRLDRAPAHPCELRSLLAALREPRAGLSTCWSATSIRSRPGELLDVRKLPAPAAHAGVVERRPDPLAHDSGGPRRRLCRRVPASSPERPWLHVPDLGSAHPAGLPVRARHRTCAASSRATS